MTDIKIVIENSSAKITGLTDLAVIDAVSRRLSYTVDSARYSYAYRTGSWDGRVRLLDKRMNFPAGLVDEVTSVLYGFGIQYQIDDQREPVICDDRMGWQGPPLRDYQNTIVDRALSAGRGMIKACTGSGKSNVIAYLCGQYNTNTVVYVVSLDLLGQMHDTISNTLGIEVGLVGGGQCDIKKITVCSAWSAGRAFDEKTTSSDEEDVAADNWKPSEQQKSDIREMVSAARLVILDEAQFAAANSIQCIVKNSQSGVHRFGFSGTPWRSDGADILLTAAFGKNICDIKASDLIELGWLVEPKIAFRDIPSNYKIKKNWADVKREYIVNNDTRNTLIVDNTLKLLEMGRKPLLLFREIAHGNILESLLPPDVKYEKVTGELSTAERDRIRADFSAGHIDLILASSVYDQGVDLPALDALVLAGGGKSTSKALQRIGRVIRGAPGKKDALVLDTWDQSHFVAKHSLTRYKAYRYEPRFKISAENGMKKVVSK